MCPKRSLTCHIALTGSGSVAANGERSRDKVLKFRQSYDCHRPQESEVSNNQKRELSQERLAPSLYEKVLLSVY